MSKLPQITHHTLRIQDPESMLAFYREKMGMQLVAQRTSKQYTHYFLGYPSLEASFIQGISEPPAPLCLLELVHHVDGWDSHSPAQKEGYWKIAVSVPDLDCARAALLQQGVQVSPAFEVPDVAYLCHLNDPEGYCIELIQHDWRHNATPYPPEQQYALRCPATFSLITLRIQEPTRSLDFYGASGLGMRLLSRQVLSERGFTLYFLGYTQETLPSEDVESLDNREWLWKRPYTVLELQHVWGTERDEGSVYATEPECGFEGFQITASDWEAVYSRLRNIGKAPQNSQEKGSKLWDAYVVEDPDGYRIRLLTRVSS